MLERLESRELLSDMPLALPTYKMAPLAGSGPPSGSFSPAQIQEAYQFNQVSFNGSGETIAIVDAYNDPGIQSDLNTFDTEFNLPTTTFSVVNESGGSSLPSADPTGGWEVEESLDVEWAHAMAPGANIMLVEASSADLSDLLAGVSYSSKHANVVSMSWGSSEFSGETSYDSYFSAPGVAFVVASGDSGAPALWPAASPNVLGVGGTTLTVNSSGAWVSETGWGDSTGSSTGGPSAYEPQPSYQTRVVTQTSTARATPDVAYDAGSAGSYAVYDSYPDEGETLDWVAVWGTSAGAPQWAAILAIADQGRAAARLSPLNSTSAQQVMDILYQNPGDFHDITNGASLGDPGYSAGPGYDYVTGLGTPMVNLIVGSLDGSTSTSPPDKMVVSAPSSATAGKSFTYTVTAENPTTGSVDTSFMGTIQFTSTDSKIQGLPSTYTFTTANDGVATFTVTLETAGSQTITETSASGSVTSTIAVSPGTAPVAESIWGTSYTPSVNSDYDGSKGQTFELGVQFESNVAGLVSGVLFYKQNGTTGTNVAHLWSSTGTLLASATFTNETSSGWQEVSFSSPVAILANTIYTVSYDTGSPLFYYESEYFAKGGVTNGNLTAPQSTTINGVVRDNGVYNYGGDFPIASQYWANFWVDVAFSPSTGSSASVKTAPVAASTSGPAAVAMGQSGYTITSAGSATPAGPTATVPGSRGTSSSTARRASVSFPVVSYRPVIRQARALVLSGQKATSLLS